MSAPIWGAVAVVTAFAFPLLLAALCAMPAPSGAAARLAPWAALPAFALAVAAPALPTLELPYLLLGTRLYSEDVLTRGFLLLTAAVWLAAGWFASSYLAHDPRRARFWGYFLASMSGNLGLVLAQDVASFYLLFALMTFAAYGVIVHDETHAARRAAYVYIVLAFIGELLLLAGLLLLTGGALNLPLEAAPRVLASSAERELLTLLLYAGFAVKAGALPLHIWLPLAHPIAPTPASAVLSGAMIKAGLLGWLRFLPLGWVSLHEIGAACALLGAVAALLFAVIGALQREPKVVLAYSSISQMGILTIVVGVLLAAPCAVAGSFSALALFALHHALSKGALFLGTAVAERAGARWPARLVSLGLLLGAASIAGAPLSGGALGKLALQHVIERAPHDWHVFGKLLSISAAGSALIMIRFLACAAPRARPSGGEPRLGLWLPWSLLLAGDALLLVFAPFDAASPGHLLEPGELVSAGWPLIAGGLAALAFGYAERLARLPRVPAGDLVVPVEAGARLLGQAWSISRGRLVAAVRQVRSALNPSRLRGAAGRALARIEYVQAGLAGYGTIGSLLALLLLAIMVLLLGGPSF